MRHTATTPTIPLYLTVIGDLWVRIVSVDDLILPGGLGARRDRRRVRPSQQAPTFRGIPASRGRIEVPHDRRDCDMLVGAAMTVAEAARAAYDAGLCVLPPVEDGKKRPQPVDGTWQQFKIQRPDPKLMGRWYPGRRGLGIVSGPVSGDAECLDFDDRATYAAFLEVAKAVGLVSVIERIEDGYCDDTPGGGVRWLWRCPGVTRQANTKLARRPKRPDEQDHPNDTVKTLIELPDFAIVAPSNGRVHPSGKPYTHRSGDFSTIATITVDERSALCDLARTFDQMPSRDQTPLEDDHRRG